MKAHDDLTFNVIGATIESPSQNPLACLYKPRVCGNKAELLRQNLCHVRLSLARRGAGLVDSRLTSPQDPSALLREVPLPLSFCGAPPAGNLISGSSAFSKTSLNIWFKYMNIWFMVHVLLKPGLENLSITLLACEISAIVQYFEHSLPLFSLQLE